MNGKKKLQKVFFKKSLSIFIQSHAVHFTLSEGLINNKLHYMLSCRQCLLVFCMFPSLAFSQRWGNIELTPEGLNTLVNKKMQSLVTGPANGTAIASYASFDPANGSFIFKGSAPLTSEKSKNNFLFLSVRLEGDLIGDNFSVLFKNSGLNAGATADLQLHYRFRKGLRQYYTFEHQEARLANSKAELLKWRNRRLAAIISSYDLSSVNANLSQYQFQTSLLEFRIKQNTQKRAEKINAINAELSNVPPNSAAIETANGELTKLEDEYATMTKQLQSLKQKTDSINTIISTATRASSLAVDESNQLDKKYEDSLAIIEQNVELRGLRFTWFTLIAGAGSKAFYTYDAALPFGTQLNRKTLETVRLGLALNYFSEQALPTSLFYGNLGFVVYEDNNLRFLTTKQLDQVKTVKNNLGDTVRTIKKTYNVYEDPIQSTHVTSLFFNGYWMNKQKTFAFHLFPTFDFISHEDDIANLGFGFVTSFKNEKKDKPIINIEAYFKINDLLNNHAAASQFWNRNEFGVSFSIPINLFK